jgi:hypothetical protein
MAKMNILVRDFDLFCEVMKSTAKIVESAKLHIDQNGLSIYGAHGYIARCEITSNAIWSNAPTEFSILSLSTFTKILQTVQDVHVGDYSTFKFIVDLPAVRFESKKFKTKIATDNEDVITKWISKKLEATLKPVFEFTTTSDLIKRIIGHQFIYDDTTALRIYLETKDDMEKNVVYGTLGNKQNNLNNEMTLKLGLVTFGSLNGRQVILDAERLNLFNSVQSNDIKIQLVDLNFLTSKVIVKGKNDSYFTVVVHNSFLKA